MASIQPVSPNLPPMRGAASAQPNPPSAEAQPANFASALRERLQHADGQQQAAAQAIRDLLAGRTEDVLPVVAAVAKADMSFKLLLGVRNKVIEAYRQTMNMQL